MSNYTPGPWTIDDRQPMWVEDIHNRDGGWIAWVPYIRGNGKVIGTVSVHTSGARDHLADIPQARANARLIAAAPDLLAALGECITDPRTLPMTARGKLREINEIAREAIAKATA